MTAGKYAIILFGHGAREPEWAQPFHKIRDAIYARNPELTVELAFLEFMEPSLPTAIEALAAADFKRITIAPLFIAQGGHLKHDLAQILEEIRTEHCSVEITLLPALGDVDAVLEMIADWLVGTIL